MKTLNCGKCKEPTALASTRIPILCLGCGNVVVTEAIDGALRAKRGRGALSARRRPAPRGASARRAKAKRRGSGRRARNVKR